jgi:hypothetical protein
MLHIKNGDITTLMTEIYTIRESDSLSYIAGLFTALNLHIRMDPKLLTGDTVGNLPSQKIFPIETSESEGKFEFLKTANRRDVWFIADRPHLRASFLGRVPLLAFSVDDIAKMGTMMDSLPAVQTRQLSRAAEGIPVVQGSTKFQEEYTKSLRSKVVFISR